MFETETAGPCLVCKIEVGESGMPPPFDLSSGYAPAFSKTHVINKKTR